MSSPGPGTADGTEATDLTRTGAYRLVSHAYRRALVECLDGYDDGVALADAAADVALRNLDRSDEASGDDDRLDVYTALHHSHVPKLADAGILDHDRDRNVVSLTERGRALAAMVVDDDAPVDAMAADGATADSIW